MADSGFLAVGSEETPQPTNKLLRCFEVSYCAIPNRYLFGEKRRELRISHSIILLMYSSNVGRQPETFVRRLKQQTKMLHACFISLRVCFMVKKV